MNTSELYISSKRLVVFNTLQHLGYRSPIHRGMTRPKSCTPETPPRVPVLSSSRSLCRASDLIRPISCGPNFGANSLAVDLEGDSHGLCIPWG